MPREKKIEIPLPKIWSFEWKGKKYEAMGKWEINWVKWAMKNNPKALDSFIKREIEQQRRLRTSPS